MNIYAENAVASDYFGFGIPDGEKLLVSGICADYVTGEREKEEFGRFVSDKIKELFKTEPFNSHNAYAIFNKGFYHLPTRAEAYKKIWKNDSVQPYVHFLEIKDEIMTEYENFYLISGIALLKSLNEINLFSVLDMFGFLNLLFFSKNNLEDIYGEFQNMQNTIFSGSAKSPTVNDGALLGEYCKNGNIWVRYGTAFTDMEVDIIYNSEDFPNTLNFMI